MTERDDRLRDLLSVELDVDPVVTGHLPADRGRATVRGWQSPPAGPAGPRDVVVLALLVVAGLVLSAVGATVLASSTAGELTVPALAPDAPGYEALVEPTPVLAVLHDVDGALDAIAVLTVPDPEAGGGGVILVPTRVMSDLPVFGPSPIEAAYDLGSPSVGTEAIGDVLGVGIAEFAVVDDDRWAGLLDPVAPLRLDNPDDLTVSVDGHIVELASGPVELDAGQVGAYLRAHVPGESELARLYRHEVFWRAWLDALSRSAARAPVPGEASRGLGWLLPRLAAAPVEIATVPVTEDDDEAFADAPVFVADRAGIDRLVAELIPFPRSPRPGVRPRVRVLDASGAPGRAALVAPSLPPLGVEVVAVGNAIRTSDTTVVTYADPAFAALARRIRDALGVGEAVLDPTASDVADITVSLGADHE